MGAEGPEALEMGAGCTEDERGEGQAWGRAGVQALSGTKSRLSQGPLGGPSGVRKPQVFSLLLFSSPRPQKGLKASPHSHSS